MFRFGVRHRRRNRRKETADERHRTSVIECFRIAIRKLSVLAGIHSQKPESPAKMPAVCQGKDRMMRTNHSNVSTFFGVLNK